MGTMHLIGAALCGALLAGPAVAAGWNESYSEKTEALSLPGDVVRGEAAFVATASARSGGPTAAIRVWPASTPAC